VNLGSLGFLTEIPLAGLYPAIEGILAGRYKVEPRMRLRVDLLRNGESVVASYDVLNDVVVNKSALARILDINVRVNGRFMTTFKADGLIVATPTGSTAYALSAQGPILHPAVPALALVPLNPHTLSARPVSVSDRCVVEISLVRAVDARAHFDGIALTDMAEGDRLVLKRSADAVRFVHPPGYRYFATLREKLRWSEVLDKNRSPE
jgi:NAD+ kinase